MRPMGVAHVFRQRRMACQALKKPVLKDSFFSIGIMLKLYYIAIAICRIRHGERQRAFRLLQDIILIKGPYMHWQHLLRLAA